MNKRNFLLIFIGSFFSILVGLTLNYFSNSLVRKVVFSSYDPQHPGVVFHDRWRSADDGYLLVNYYGEYPTCHVLDYTGSTVYKFPMGFCEFPPDGRFTSIMGEVTQFDQLGAIEWISSKYRQHHDTFYSISTGELFLIARRLRDYETKDGVRPLHVDYVVGLDRGGNEIFRWDIEDYFPQLSEILGHPIFQTGLIDGGPGDHTHLNTIEIIGPNRYENKIPGFQRGNILLNCFLQGLIFIIDRQTGKIVWHYKFESQEMFEGAHTVQLLDNGHLFFLWNRRKLDDQRFYSSVTELDPLTNKVVWEYTGTPKEDFYVDRWGSAFAMGPDRFLLDYSTKGIVAQIDRSGRILWEWHTPPKPDNSPTQVYQVIPISKELVQHQISIWKSLEAADGN